MFDSIISSDGITLKIAAICTGVSLLLGIIIACTHYYTGNTTKKFAVTLVLMPAIVQMVIMLVNGNLGAGVAVAGAFSLIRFRSTQGDSREIASVFFAMAIGLATGMGYVVFAACFAVIIAAIMLVLYKVHLFEKSEKNKILKITIPEDLDYESVFTDIFENYTSSHVLRRVKTTNLGSMFIVEYIISLKSNVSEKAMIDEIRTRNGNLTIVCSQDLNSEEGL